MKKIRIVTLRSDGTTVETTETPGKKVRLSRHVRASGVQALIRKKREEMVAKSADDEQGN